MKTMKTAIYLPDRVFFATEETAQDLGISRSALYVDALTEYLEKYSRKNITQKLNEVYGDDEYQKEFEPLSNAALEDLRKLTKNDTW
jgi:HSP90 family molecular chaperone